MYGRNSHVGQCGSGRSLWTTDSDVLNSFERDDARVIRLETYQSPSEYIQTTLA